MLKEIMENDKGVTRIARSSRHRFGTDGPGIRTLVPLIGCHLDCAYCINESLRSFKGGIPCTPEELLEEVKRDDIYFRSSGGGITFGGGEPLLHADFIRRFCEIRPPEWTIAIETSLNVPCEDVEGLLESVDLWIIDIKDMDPGRYLEYTGESNEHVLENLDLLSKRCSSTKVRIRVPRIGGLNTQQDVDKSVEAVRVMGFETEVFEYRIPRHLLKESADYDFLPGELIAPTCMIQKGGKEEITRIKAQFKEEIEEEIRKMWLPELGGFE